MSLAPFPLAGKPFTLDHFVSFCELMVFEDERRRTPERWQQGFAADLFDGARENWLIVPEGNGKSTFTAQLGLYGLNFALEPWIPIGAASRDQAEIIHGQAAGFVRRTGEIQALYRVYDGYRKIVSLVNGGRGMKVYPHDPNTGDGIIPFPFALIDEPHRHPDMRLYGLWKGKLKKRGGQIVAISTAGEPGTPFEEMREEIRDKATDRHRAGPFLRALGSGVSLHEYMVQADEDCADMDKVAEANPLEQVTAEALGEEFGSATLDLNDWKRLKCNRPTRSVRAAITDAEWEGMFAGAGVEIPAGADVLLGVDAAWKWDTFSIVPLWAGPKYRLLGSPRILTPPRDGSSMHPDVVKEAFLELNEDFKLTTVVMDMSRAEDIAHWIEDELGVEVIDRQQSNPNHVGDYEAFMDGVRNGTLKHTGDEGLRRHALNAVARRLPGGDHRFDRPSTNRQNVREQDRRVVDALTAAAMVVQHSTLEKPKRSVYAERFKDAEPVQAA